jgi:hypothetical protein
LQILHVIVLVPPHRAPRNLQSLFDGIVDRFVGDNDISPLAKRWDDTRYRRERLRVDDAGARAEECSNVRLNLHVDVLCAVESRGATGPHAVGAEGLNGALFEVLIRDEVVVVVGREVRDGSAIGEL